MSSSVSYGPPAPSLSRTNPRLGHSYGKYIPQLTNGLLNHQPMATQNIQRNVQHAMIIRPQPRPKYRYTTRTTSSMWTSTTTTTTSTTTTSTTISTASTTTFEVNQTKMKEITLEFSSLLKSSLFQLYLTELHAGDQIIKTIEFQLPPKIKMEFTLNASGAIQKICLDRTLFDHNIARLIFKRDFAAKLAGLNELEKNLLSC